MRLNRWLTVRSVIAAIAVSGLLIWLHGLENGDRLKTLIPRVFDTAADKSVSSFSRREVIQRPEPEGSVIQVSVLNEEDDMCPPWIAQNDEEDATEWWHWACLIERLLSTIDYQCRESRKLGKHWSICLDEPWHPRNNCLVYSFGIGFNFRFDDSLANVFKCAVFSFDPSMNKSSHQRSDRVHFLNLGLSDKNDDNFAPRRDTFVRKPQVWKIRNLKTIFSMLGHHEATLDVLKMDVELTEWPVLEYLLKETDILPRVRQLMIEWHMFRNLPPAENFRQMYKNLVSLRNLGFYAFRSLPFRWQNKPERRNFSCLAEMGYVNMNLKS